MSKQGSGMEPVMSVPDKDIELLKIAFKGNEHLLKLVRGVFFNFPLTEGEKKTVKDLFKGTELTRIFKERLLPKLGKDTPIGQIGDVWLGVEQMIFGQHKDTIYQAVTYKDLAIRMSEKGIDRLSDPDSDGVELTYSPTMYPSDELQVNLLARNQYIRHVETQLQMIWLIVNQEVKKESKKDSSE